MAKKANYSKITGVKTYKRYKGTPKEHTVSAHPRSTGYGYDRDDLIRMHLSRPIIDRAIDERIPANLISEHKWVASGGNAGDLEGIDDRVTSTHDLTPEQKIAVLNGILKRLGIKAQVVIAEPIEPTKPTPTAKKAPVKKAIPYALRTKKEQEQIKEEVKKEAIKKIKEKKPKTVSKSELEEMLEGLEGL